MNLKKYLETSERGAASSLAEKLEISLSYLSQLASGRSSLSAERCVAIEQATNGAVTRKDLRPNDFWKIWPDLSKESAKEGV